MEVNVDIVNRLISEMEGIIQKKPNVNLEFFNYVFQNKEYEIEVNVAAQMVVCGRTLEESMKIYKKVKSDEEWIPQEFESTK